MNNSTVNSSNDQTSEIKFSLFDGLRDTTPSSTLSLSELVSWIKNPKDPLKEKTDTLRDHLDYYRLDDFKALKESLPCVTLSGTFTKRGASGLELHNGFMSIDLDALGRDFDRARDALRSDPHCALLFTSPSGIGLKGLMRINPVPVSPEEHKTAFYAVESYIKKTYGLTIDAACSDVSRLAFLCHDADCHLNEEATALDTDDWITNDPAQMTEDEAMVERLSNILNQGALLSIKTPPPELAVILQREDGTVIGEAGNMITVEGAVKCGKSGILSAIIGAAVSENLEGDFLGLEVPERDGFILHFDCEQSHKAHHKLITNAVSRRGGLEDIPNCLKTFSLLDAAISDRWPACELAVDDLAKNGQIRMVIFDGGADFLVQLNDEEESRIMVQRMHQLAHQYQCLVIIVIHENPNAEGGKTRGHFGSELWRKSQSCLGVIKGSDAISSVYGKFLRDGEWLQKDSHYFKWDLNAGMHVTCDDPSAERMAAKDDLKKKSLRDLASKVFKTDLMKHKDLELAIVKATGLSDRTARTRITEMVSHGAIEQHDEGYRRIA
jgi:VirE N-terminal domain